MSEVTHTTTPPTVSQRDTWNLKASASYTSKVRKAEKNILCLARGDLVPSSLKAFPNICVYFALRHQVYFDHHRNQSYKGNWLGGMEKNFPFLYFFEMVSCHLADYFAIMEAWGAAEKDNGAEVLQSRKLLAVKKLDNGSKAAMAISSQIVPLTYIC